MRWLRWGLLGATALLLGAGGLWLGKGTAGFRVWVWGAMVWAAAGAGLTLGAVWLWRRAPLDGRWLLGLLAVGALARGAALPAEPYLSDDAFRYHWDGKVLAHGINPFLHPPASPALDPLRVDAMDGRINHPTVRTVYPPFAQLLFAAGYLLTPGSLLGFHLIVLLGELATWALLLVELARRRLPAVQVLIAAWAPLAVLEGYLPGHLDALALPWLTLFVVALGRGQSALAGGALGLAALIKPWPLLFVPVAIRALGRRRSLPFLAALGAVGLGLYLPFASAGWHLFSSMWLMARQWANNASLGALLELALPPMAARAAAGALLLAAVAAATAWGRDLTSRLLLVSAAFVVCTPNLFPWYLLPLLPLLALRPDPALLALVALFPFTEAVNIQWRLEGVWTPPAWPLWVAYVPFYTLLGLSAWRRWGMFAEPPGRPEAHPAETLSPGAP